MSDSALSTYCACGHTANYHPSREQQSAHLRGSNGRHPGECKGGQSTHCRCITNREEVIAAVVSPPVAADQPHQPHNEGDRP